MTGTVFVHTKQDEWSNAGELCARCSPATIALRADVTAYNEIIRAYPLQNWQNRIAMMYVQYIIASRQLNM